MTSGFTKLNGTRPLRGAGFVVSGVFDSTFTTLNPRVIG